MRVSKAFRGFQSMHLTLLIFDVIISKKKKQTKMRCRKALFTFITGDVIKFNRSVCDYYGDFVH